MQRPQFLLHKRHLSEFPFKVDLLSNSMQLTLISYEYTYVHPLSLRSFYATRPGPVPGSLRKHPFLLALRRDGPLRITLVQTCRTSNYAWVTCGLG